jgi:hypothetical protein
MKFQYSSEAKASWNFPLNISGSTKNLENAEETKSKLDTVAVVNKGSLS